MSHSQSTQEIHGRLQQLLFSPKGMIEGILISAESGVLQVSMSHDEVDIVALQGALGKSVELKADPDHSPKTKHAALPVFALCAFTKLGGKATSSRAAAAPVSGVVAMIHYAKHGEPNGVILESGEFIHTRPPGMKKLKLKVGSQVSARGEIRVTALGTPLVEAREVNRVKLE